MLIAVKFFAFENYGQEVGGPIYCWSPNLKVGGPVSPGRYGCYAYGYLPI